MDQMNRLRQSKICDRGMGRELIISNLNPVIIKTQQHLRQQKVFSYNRNKLTTNFTD